MTRLVKACNLGDMDGGIECMDQILPLPAPDSD